MCGFAVRDIGVGFEHVERLAETVVLQRPSGIDGKRVSGLRPLLDPAFPSAGVDQHIFNDVPPVGIDRPQKFVSHLADRVLRRPSIGFFCSLVPEGDHAAPIPDKDHVVREVQ